MANVYLPVIEKEDYNSFGLLLGGHFSLSYDDWVKLSYAWKRLGGSAPSGNPGGRQRSVALTWWSTSRSTGLKSRRRGLRTDMLVVRRVPCTST
jgi:hypothetical protein